MKRLILFALLAPAAFGQSLIVTPTALTFPKTDTGFGSQFVHVDSVPATLAIQTQVSANWLTAVPSFPTTPAFVEVRVDRTGLAPGTYQGIVTISVTGIAPVFVPVTLVVSGPLTLSPSQLTFQYTPGGPAPAAQPISINGPAGAPFSVSTLIGSGGNWLSASPGNGNFVPAGSTISVDVNPTNVPPGIHSALVYVNSAGQSPQAVLVELVIGSGSLSASPQVLTFLTAPGGLPPDQQLVVNTQFASSYTITPFTFTGGSWLSAVPASGVTNPNATVTVRANSSQLAAGNYAGYLEISDGIRKRFALVNLILGGPSISPASLSFSYQTDGLPTPNQTLTLAFNADVSFTATASTNQGGNWLSALPATGAISGQQAANISVGVNPQGLGNGIYTGNVTITVPNFATIVVPVTLSIGGATLNNTTSVSISAPVGRTYTVDGVTYNIPRTFVWVIGSSHTLSTSSPQFTPDGSRFLFETWSNSNQITQTVVASATTPLYSLSFRTQHRLTTSASPPGSAVISLEPFSPDSYYDAGSSVRVTAVPATGYSFGTWSGPAVDVTSNPFTIQMNNPQALTAIQFGNVTITSNPPGLRVLVDGVEATAPVVRSWVGGTQHTISAVAAQPVFPGTRYGFLSWSDGGAFSHTVTPSGTNPVYTVNYGLQHQLNTRTFFENTGTFGFSPPSVDGFYDTGTIVNVTFTPATSYRFTGWQGAANGSTNPQPIAVTDPKELVAVADPLPACAYSLSRPGASVLPTGDIGRIAVSTGAFCSWQAISEVAWITISAGTSGSGNGFVRYHVAANPGNNARSGRLTIAGIPFDIRQSASSCEFSLTPTAQVALPDASSYALSAVTPPGCAFIPAATTNWITLQSAAIGYGLSTNNDWLPRIGSIEVGGQAFPILQKVLQPMQFFNDVPLNHPFADFIALTSLKRLTTGCGNQNFCPDAPLTRADMAEIIIRALYGETFNFPSAPYFSDVPADHPRFRFIQKMRELGITSGCTSTTYCPSQNTNRGEMAVFLTRARSGLASGLPYTEKPFFADVPATHLFFPAIQKIREYGITIGCTSSTYCVNDAVTRGQMAVFTSRALIMK